MTFQRFVVDVLTSAGVVDGSGPLYNVLSVEITEELDRIGRIAVTVPATDERVIALVSAEKQLRIRTADGIIATGIMHSIALGIGEAGKPTRIVSGPDLLEELVYPTTGYSRVYDDVDVKAGIVGTHATATSLLGGTNWTQSSVEDYGKATITYDAVSRFKALTTLARQLGRHVRQGTTARTLNFGLFGANSGIRLTNVHHVLAAQADVTDVAWIGSASIGVVSADVENRLFPLGKSKFDMRDAQSYQINTSSPATGAITNATNAAPIVVTSAGHGLATNDFVRVAEVGGNTAANGDWQIIVVDANTFSLNGSTGNGAYTAGGRWDKIEAATILVQTNGGPTGVETTTTALITAADTTFTVASATGIAVGDELWLGDETDWTQWHEIVIVDDVTGLTITVLDEFANGYANGTTVIRNPQFYVEDAASQGVYGIRENCPPFAWIAPVDKSAELAQQQRAADALYAAAKARLTRYKDEYKSYILSTVLGLPHDLRVGEKVRVVFRGAIGVFGGTLYEEIDADFYVVKITRTFAADGKRSAALEVANVSRPTPNNADLVLFNLDTNRWIGL